MLNEISLRLLHRAASIVNGGRRDEGGQALVEYALILGVIAVAAIAALTVLRDDIVRLLEGVVNGLPG